MVTIPRLGRSVRGGNYGILPTVSIGDLPYQGKFVGKRGQVGHLGLSLATLYTPAQARVFPDLILHAKK